MCAVKVQFTSLEMLGVIFLTLVNQCSLDCRIIATICIRHGTLSSVACPGPILHKLVPIATLPLKGRMQIGAGHS